MVSIKLFLLVFLSMFMSCSAKEFSIDYRNTEVVIDGSNEDAVWNKCHPHTIFYSPWLDAVVPSTSFKSFHDGDYLYFHFDIQDKLPKCFEGKNLAESVEYSDRAEIFFSIDQEMTQYYGIEIDACGRMIDFKSNGYRNFEEVWDFPQMEEKDYQVTLTTSGYQVEGRIRLNTLKEINVLKNGQLIMGIFRANFLKEDSKKEAQWISWKPIETKKPDFHKIYGFRTVKIGD